jgi:hypothetical protein
MKYIIEGQNNKSIMVEKVDFAIQLTIGDQSIRLPFSECCDLTQLLKEFQQDMVHYAAASMPAAAN